MLHYTNVAIIFPRIYVRAFNAASAPHTWGSPSPTAFTGLATALQLRNPEREHSVIHSAGLVVHELQPLVTETYYGDSCFNLTRNPVKKNGETAAIVENARANMTCSVVIGLDAAAEVIGDRLDKLASDLFRCLLTMGFSGGAIFPDSPTAHRPRISQPIAILLDDNNENARDAEKRTLRRLLPGFALVSRHGELMRHHRERCRSNPDANFIDSWMDFGRIRYIADEPDDDAPSAKVMWRGYRPTVAGWLVPIPVGYAGISEVHPPGSVKRARSRDYSFRFVEAAYSVGEWLGPHRLDSIKSLLWYADVDEANALYICKNDYESSY